MSIKRRQNDPLDLAEISDANLRKNVFREIGRDLSYHGSTDMPGAIARLMEKAFKAGLKLGTNPNFSPYQKDTNRPMTEMDIPSSPRKKLFLIRVVLGADNLTRNRPPKKLVSEALVLIMRPRRPGLSIITRDEWLLPCEFKKDGLSNRVVMPLIKLGLYTTPHDLALPGWKATFVTEWGFELLMTGQTRGLTDRKPGKSSTWSQYRNLMGDDLDDLLKRAGRTLGLIKDS